MSRSGEGILGADYLRHLRSGCAGRLLSGSFMAARATSLTPEMGHRRSRHAFEPVSHLARLHCARAVHVGTMGQRGVRAFVCRADAVALLDPGVQMEQVATETNGPEPVLPEAQGGFQGVPVLVTGGASFIGSHLVGLLCQSGAKVTVADDFSSGKSENLAEVIQHVLVLEGDLRDPSFAEKACADQELVFHLAASHGGRGYIDTHPVECVNNVMLDHLVFSAAARAGIRKVIYASSACVYPTSLQASATDRLLLAEGDANFDEPGKAFADGEYGWAKLMGELQLRAFHKQ